MPHSVHSQFLEHLEQTYPKTWGARGDFEIKSELISPFQVEVPLGIFDQVESFRQALYQVTSSETYQKTILGDSLWTQAPQNLSTLTALDFHYSENTGLKLIEINTNASLLLPYRLLRQVNQSKELPLCHFDHYWNDFVTSYKTIFAQDPREIWILDEEPKNEGLYFEFLMCQEYFQSLGLTAKVFSQKEYNQQSNSPSLVYNRLTDFYFEQPQSQNLKKHYFEKTQAITPNPLGYLLMADKNRLPTLREHLEKMDVNLAQMIPKSFSFTEFESLESLWTQRKKYFLKPKNSYGGKGAFSGKGISRKMFNSLDPEQFIAQELVPPGKIQRTLNNEEISLKFDLRFYITSKGIIDAGARLYQGQTTNMRTPNGGIAPLIIA